ncbi:hypothetical protein TL16_g03509 [Triparma laevis f. inornata]|uniref:START domain-containing protein n=2 Tax=Triparma laevis TaxID=1534972 RepID=A0A9W7L0G2_9STRA|nr:hypothetical protein TL16_g03509 [Triparma laevis f. inornata]GMI17885.1 hypothetical protein TrLO_g1379 [Triparma laevis f. longispina]
MDLHFNCIKFGKRTKISLKRWLRVTSTHVFIHKTSAYTDEGAGYEIRSADVKVLPKAKDEFRILVGDKGTVIIVRRKSNEGISDLEWKALGNCLQAATTARSSQVTLSPVSCVEETTTTTGAFPYEDTLVARAIASAYNQSVNDRNVDNKKTADEYAWKKNMTSTNVNGEVLTVETSRCVTSSAIRIRLKTTVIADLNRCKTVLNDYPERLEWDANMHGGGILKRWHCPADQSPDGKPGEIILVTYTTNPALGGSISPRTFLEVRWCSSNKNLESRAFVCYDIKEGVEWISEYVEDMVAKKNVYARNIEGSQYMEKRVLEDGRIATDITMLSVTEIGGSLPQYVINKACIGSMVESIKAATKYIEG